MILSHSLLVSCPLQLTHIKGVSFPGCLHSPVQKISVSQKLLAVTLLLNVLIDFGWLGLGLFGFYFLAFLGGLKVFIKWTRSDHSSE